MKIFGKNITLSGIIKTVAPVVAIFYPPAAVVVGEYLGFTGAAAAAAGAATINAAAT